MMGANAADAALALKISVPFELSSLAVPAECVCGRSCRPAVMFLREARVTVARPRRPTRALPIGRASCRRQTLRRAAVRVPTSAPSIQKQARICGRRAAQAG